MKESGDVAMKMGEISKKVKERRLRWYGHVIRREEHYIESERKVFIRSSQKVDTK